MEIQNPSITNINKSEIQASNITLEISHIRNMALVYPEVILTKIIRGFFEKFLIILNWLLEMFFDFN